MTDLTEAVARGILSCATSYGLELDYAPGSTPESVSTGIATAALAAIAANGHTVVKADPVGITCPFCMEDDFDEIGLKNHLSQCEDLAMTPLTGRAILQAAKRTDDE